MRKSTEVYGVKDNFGFTLIELLVVIAIIGILASIVLSALNESRRKADEASARSALSHARAGAEIAYSENSFVYSNTCPTDVLDPVTGTNAVTVLEAFHGVAQVFDNTLTGGDGAGDNYDNLGGTPDARGDVGCQANANEYMLQVYLTPTRTLCIDSTGYAGNISSAKATNLAVGSVKCL